MIGVKTLPQRLGEVGRIRLGDEKIDARRPGAPLDRFRVTVAEHDRSILEDVIAVYGGEIRPWKDNDGSPAWQAILTAETIEVAIPPDDSALSIWYEQWRGGYCVVRCNGLRCQRPVGKGADAHWEEGPCRCEPDDAEACALVTRLNVVLLGVPAYGLFRLDTGSTHAARTFPAVVDMAQRLARDGRPVPATLAIQAKTTKNLGRATPKQNFRIPVLRLAVGLTKEALLAGPSSDSHGLSPAADMPALPPPSDWPEDAAEEAIYHEGDESECPAEPAPAATTSTSTPTASASPPTTAGPPAAASGGGSSAPATSTAPPWIDTPHAELLKDQGAYSAFLAALKREGGSLGQYQRQVGGSIADHTPRRILRWASGAAEE